MTEKMTIHLQEPNGRFSRRYFSPGVFSTFETMKNLRSWCARNIPGVSVNDGMSVIGDRRVLILKGSDPFFPEGRFLVCIGETKMLVVVGPVG